MTDVVKRPAIASISQETLAVRDRLKAAAVGEVVSWDELERLTSVPRARVYRAVTTAVRMLENDFKMHFITRTGLGVERLDFLGVAHETMPRKQKKMIRAARDTVRTVRNIQLDDLPVQERTRVLLIGSVAALAEQAASNASIKQLEAKVEKDRFLSPLTPKEAMARLLSG